MKYIITNVIEDKQVFSGNSNEFMDFVRRITIENEDYDYSILGISDAEEYLEMYCDNLSLEQCSYYVDIPDFRNYTEDEASWINIDSFGSREEAIAFAKEYFGADDEGRIQIVTG